MPEVIFFFKLNMNFNLLIHTETAKINGKFGGFKPQKLVICPANKCLNIYEQDKFQSQLS